MIKGTIHKEDESESEVAQLCLIPCDPMDCNFPGFSVHGIFQARVPERVVISFSRGSSPPRDWTQVSLIAGRRLTVWATRETHKEDRQMYLKFCISYVVIRYPKDKTLLKNMNFTEFQDVELSSFLNECFAKSIIFVVCSLLVLVYFHFWYGVTVFLFLYYTIVLKCSYLVCAGHFEHNIVESLDFA